MNLYKNFKKFDRKYLFLEYNLTTFLPTEPKFNRKFKNQTPVKVITTSFFLKQTNQYVRIAKENKENTEFKTLCFYLQFLESTIEKDFMLLHNIWMFFKLYSKPKLFTLFPDRRSFFCYWVFPFVGFVTISNFNSDIKKHCVLLNPKDNNYQLDLSKTSLELNYDQIEYLNYKKLFLRNNKLKIEKIQSYVPPKDHSFSVLESNHTSRDGLYFPSRFILPDKGREGKKTDIFLIKQTKITNFATHENFNLINSSKFYINKAAELIYNNKNSTNQLSKKNNFTGYEKNLNLQNSQYILQANNITETILGTHFHSNSILSDYCYNLSNESSQFGSYFPTREGKKKSVHTSRQAKELSTNKTEKLKNFDKPILNFSFQNQHKSSYHRNILKNWQITHNFPSKLLSYQLGSYFPTRQGNYDTSISNSKNHLLKNFEPQNFINKKLEVTEQSNNIFIDRASTLIFEAEKMKTLSSNLPLAKNHFTTNIKTYGKEVMSLTFGDIIDLETQEKELIPNVIKEFKNKLIFSQSSNPIFFYEKTHLLLNNLIDKCEINFSIQLKPEKLQTLFRNQIKSHIIFEQEANGNLASINKLDSTFLHYLSKLLITAKSFQKSPSLPLSGSMNRIGKYEPLSSQISKLMFQNQKPLINKQRNLYNKTKQTLFDAFDLRSEKKIKFNYYLITQKNLNLILLKKNFVNLPINKNLLKFSPPSQQSLYDIVNTYRMQKQFVKLQSNEVAKFKIQSQDSKSIKYLLTQSKQKIKKNFLISQLNLKVNKSLKLILDEFIKHEKQKKVLNTFFSDKLNINKVTKIHNSFKFNLMNSSNFIRSSNQKLDVTFEHGSYSPIREGKDFLINLLCSSLNPSIPTKFSVIGFENIKTNHDSILIKSNLAKNLNSFEIMLSKADPIYFSYEPYLPLLGTINGTPKYDPILFEKSILKNNNKIDSSQFFSYRLHELKPLKNYIENPQQELQNFSNKFINSTNLDYKSLIFLANGKSGKQFTFSNKKMKLVANNLNINPDLIKTLPLDQILKYSTNIRNQNESKNILFNSSLTSNILISKSKKLKNNIIWASLKINHFNFLDKQMFKIKQIKSESYLNESWNNAFARVKNKLYFDNFGNNKQIFSRDEINHSYFLNKVNKQSFKKLAFNLLSLPLSGNIHRVGKYEPMSRSLIRYSKNKIKSTQKRDGSVHTSRQGKVLELHSSLNYFFKKMGVDERYFNNPMQLLNLNPKKLQTTWNNLEKIEISTQFSNYITNLANNLKLKLRNSKLYIIKISNKKKLTFNTLLKRNFYINLNSEKTFALKRNKLKYHLSNINGNQLKTVGFKYSLNESKLKPNIEKIFRNYLSSKYNKMVLNNVQSVHTSVRKNEKINFETNKNPTLVLNKKHSLSFLKRESSFSDFKIKNKNLKLKIEKKLFNQKNSDHISQHRFILRNTPRILSSHPSNNLSYSIKTPYNIIKKVGFIFFKNDIKGLNELSISRNLSNYFRQLNVVSFKDLVLDFETLKNNELHKKRLNLDGYKKLYLFKNHKKQNLVKRLEKAKNLQKKRRQKKQARLTGRRKKRKRFFPRPIWLRFFLYKKFVKFRHFSPNKIKFYNKNSIINDNLSKVVNLISNSNQIHFNPHINAIKINNRTIRQTIYRSNKQNWGNLFFDIPNLEKITIKKLFLLESLPIFNQIKLYDISTNLLNDFKNTMWKSYWLRTNFSNYIKKIQQYLDQIKNSVSESYILINLKNFFFELWGLNCKENSLKFFGLNLNYKNKLVVTSVHTSGQGTHQRISNLENYKTKFKQFNTFELPTNKKISNSNFSHTKNENYTSLWYLNIRQNFSTFSAIPSGYSYLATSNLVQFNSTLYDRIQYIIKNVKSNLNVDGHSQLRAFNPGRSYRTNFISDNFLQNLLKDWWIRVENSLNYSFSIVNIPQEIYLNQAKFRILWGLNKTNVWSFKKHTDNNITWTRSKIRDQNKSNKTNKSIHTFFTRIKHLNKTKSSRRQKLIHKIFLEKFQNTNEKLQQLGMLITDKESLKNQFPSRIASYFLTREGKYDPNLVGKYTLINQYSKYRRPLVSWVTKNISHINLSKTNHQLSNLILKENLNYYFKTHPKNYLQFWWSEANSQHYSLIQTDVSFKNDFSLLTKSTHVNIPSNKTKVFLIGQLKYNFLMIWSCLILFHVCLLFTVLNIGQIRTFLKFQLLFIYKITNIYLTIIYWSFKNLKQLKTTLVVYSNISSNLVRNLTLTKKSFLLLTETDLHKSSYLSTQMSNSNFFKENKQANITNFINNTKSTKSVLFNSNKISNIIIYTHGQYILSKEFEQSILKSWSFYNDFSLPSLVRKYDPICSYTINFDMKNKLSFPCREVCSESKLEIRTDNFSTLVKNILNSINLVCYNMLKSTLGWSQTLSLISPRSIKSIKTFSTYVNLTLLPNQYQTLTNLLLNKYIIASFYLSILFFFSIVIKLSNKSLISLYTILFKLIDFVEGIMLIIYKSLEKPAELMIDFISEFFLIEWSSDIVSFIPETFDIYTSAFSQKLSRNFRIFGFTSFFWQRRFLCFIDMFIDGITKPDIDLIIRQKKGIIFWDIWAEILIQAAEIYSINLSSLFNIKEEQDVFLEKLINEQKWNWSNDVLAKMSPLMKLVKNSKPIGFSNNSSIFCNSEQIWRRWSVNPYSTYQAKDTDLFVESHPPKSFSHFKLMKYYPPVFEPVGNLVCQIYSGQFVKSVSKNLLLVGSRGTNKTLLIQALAGETELKIMIDNAKRYALTSKGIAIGMKLLKDVFDALALQAPCLFIIEDIHVIGERRPMLISDDENIKAMENSFGVDQEEIHEKNQVIYQLSRHSIVHYKKPYKGDFSLLIPTNHFALDFFLGASPPKTRIISEVPENPLPINAIEQEISHQNESDKSQYSLSSNKFRLLSQIQLPKKETFSPPSTSPFTILLLKEQKKLKPKKIVSEMPWGGLSSDQLIQLPKSSYSVRVKVALLADIAIRNLSVKLDRITDLLIIIDSVRSHRGFVVIGTTHIPSILDPALRRPGRFDETLTIPAFPNLWSRWEILKASVADFSSTLDLIDLAQLFNNLNDTELSTIIAKTKLFLLTKQSFLSKNLKSQQLKTRLLQYNKIKNQSLKTTPTNDLTLLNSFGTVLKCATYPLIIDPFQLKQHKKILPDSVDTSKQVIGSYFRTQFILPDKVREGSDAIDYVKNKNLNYLINDINLMNAESNSISDSFLLSVPTYPEEKVKINSVASHLKTFNSALSIFKTSTNSLAISYFQISKWFISSQLVKDQRSYTSLLWSTISKNSLHSSESLFSSDSFNSIVNQTDYNSTFAIYSSTKDLKNQLLQLFAGKIGEFFAFYDIKSMSRLLQENNNNLNLNMLGPNVRQGEVYDIKNYDLFWNEFQSINTWKYSSLINISGLDESCRKASNLIFSIIYKRCLYNKNILVSRLFNLHNIKSLRQPPSPPVSISFIAAKRYENYKRIEFDSQNRVTFSVHEKIQKHQQQRYIKTLYNQPVQKYFRSELEIHNKNSKLSNSLITTFENSFREISLIDINHKLQSKNKSSRLSSSSVFFNNRINIRHRFYLLNQWWTTQLAEHNAETTFLSEIDWRYMFIETIGDLWMDFPDTDQHYNPRTRQWILTSGYWSYWYNFEKLITQEIYYQFLMESFYKAYNILETSREFLDLTCYQFLTSSILKEVNFINCLKRFYK